MGAWYPLAADGDTAFFVEPTAYGSGHTYHLVSRGPLDVSRPMLERLQLKRSGEAVVPLIADLTALPFAAAHAILCEGDSKKC